MNLSLLTSTSDYIILNVVYYVSVTRELMQFEPLAFSSLKTDGEFLHSLTLICFYQSQNWKQTNKKEAISWTVRGSAAKKKVTETRTEGDSKNQLMK